MTSTINVLCLEDDPDSAERLRSALVTDGLDVTFEIATSRKAFEEALDRGAVDVILAKPDLAAPDALSTLELVRNRGSAAAVILLADGLDTETAVEAVKQGASDCVFESSSGRLPSVVRRALPKAKAESEREAETEALRREVRRFRDLVDRAGVAIVADDRAGRLTFFNRAFAELWGYPEDRLRSMSIWDLIHPEDREWVRLRHEKRYAADPSAQAWYPFRGVKSRGETIHLEVNTVPQVERGRVVGSLSFIHDISGEKRLEADLARSQKLNALGQLAGGIAHDFNNLLMSILGSAELLGLRFSSTDAETLELDTIRDAATRGAELCQRLLAVARQQVLRMDVVDLNGFVADELSMLRRLIPENVTFELKRSDDNPAVVADPSQLSQVLLNLVVNARDAMPDGGTITVSTGVARVGEEDAALRPGIDPGDYGVLTVEDSGEGMSAVTMAHIFEPFYTTKPDGKGTGLGLATAYGIVTQHRGIVEVESAPGEGTRFDILLPAARNGDSPVTAEKTSGFVNGSETILVVEDEARVRATVTRMLRAQGYTVLEADNGNEALAVLGGGAEVDLVLTDVVMPTMGGRQLLHEVRRINPKLPFLFSSGYTDESMRDLLASCDKVRFIGKPFTMEQLSRAVRDALGGEDGT